MVSGAPGASSRGPCGVGGRATALDVGAAGGGNTRVLQALGWRAAALEYGEEGARVCAERGIPVLRGDATRLPSPAESLDLVVAYDVLEHIDDDAAAAKGVFRAAAPGGVFLVAVPCDMKLWSAHDVAVNHVRRYSRAGLLGLLTGRGIRDRGRAVVDGAAAARRPAAPTREHRQRPRRPARLAQHRPRGGRRRRALAAGRPAPGGVAAGHRPAALSSSSSDGVRASRVRESRSPPRSTTGVPASGCTAGRRTHRAGRGTAAARRRPRPLPRTSTSSRRRCVLTGRR